MTAAEIRKASLRQLLDTRKQMMSTLWMEEIKTASEADRLAAARLLLQVQHAILEMQNAKLADIRDKLVANEKALGDGIDSLKKSLKTVENIRVAIQAVGQFLQIVGRVVKLLATA